MYSSPKEVIPLLNLIWKKSWLFIVILICTSLFLFFYFRDIPKETIEEEPSFSFLEEIDQPNEESVEDEKIIVDVKGEVKKPGVYEASVNDRIYDVVQLAGGFTMEADQVSVPLAQKVQDEMTIYIPREGEVSEEVAHFEMGQTDSDKIKVNQASQQELETLPGIGPAKAQAILQYIEENGSFSTLEDMLEVPGIGEKTLENLRESIQVP